MAPKSNLVKTVVVDKNGVLTTRWVKRDDAGKVTTVSIPTVAVTDSKRDELLALATEMEAEQQRIMEDADQGNDYLYAGLRKGSIKKALHNKNLDALRTYSELFRIDDLDPRNVDRCILVCERALHAKSAGKVTETHVRAVRSFTTALSDDEDYSTSAQRARDVLLDVCIEMSLRDVDDIPQIVSILNRGVRAPWQLQDILEESKNSHKAVQDGIL